MLHISDTMPATKASDSLQAQVAARTKSRPELVWTAADFADLGSRSAVDKTLQRLAGAGELRRIDRGLYDRPRRSALTQRPAPADYRAVIDAVARRDKVRVVVDGLTAANDLGLTTAVPARVEVLVDARLQPIRLDSLEIRFKTAAPSRLYWAGRPGMRIVQALYWLQDTLQDPDERARVAQRLRGILSDPDRGPAARDDLRAGLSALPIWMQELLRDLLQDTSVAHNTSSAVTKSVRRQRQK